MTQPHHVPLKALMSEDRLTVDEVADSLGIPARRVYHYMSRGLRGVLLEWFTTTKRYTTRQAIDRFEAAVAETHAPKKTKVRRARRASVARALDGAGL